MRITPPRQHYIQPDLFGGQEYKGAIKTFKAGLNYKGNKSAIVQDIFQAIKNIKPYSTAFYDLFGGGGCVTVNASNNWEKVVYNELHKDIASAVEFICNRDNYTQCKGGNWHLPDPYWKWIEREEFFDLRNSEGGSFEERAYRGFILCTWSFGGGTDNYLYGRDKIELKRNMTRVFMDGDEDALDWLIKETGVPLTMPTQACRYDRRRHISAIFRRHVRLEAEQAERAEQAQRAQQAQQAQQAERAERAFYSLSYEEVPLATPLEDTVIYCDPPYENTDSYRGEKFDHGKFFKWAKGCPYPVFISEYKYADGFEVVMEKEKLSLLSPNSRNTVRELLLWNGK